MTRHRRTKQIHWQRRFYLVGKRAFDLAFASCALLLTSPFLAIIALLTWLDSPGPVFFRQRRVGKGGKEFTLYKIRTMYVDSSPYSDSPTDDQRDLRVTRLGRLLRKSGLDELPQFINVLRGEMSVVGPRPEMRFLVDLYNAKQRRRLDVLPGITGLWQISPVRSRPIHENLRYDYYYVRRQSFGLDLQIIGATLLVMLKGLTLRIAPREVAPAGRIEEPARPRTLFRYPGYTETPQFEPTREPVATLAGTPKA